MEGLSGKCLDGVWRVDCGGEVSGGLLGGWGGSWRGQGDVGGSGRDVGGVS